MHHIAWDIKNIAYKIELFIMNIYKYYNYKRFYLAR